MPSDSLVYFTNVATESQWRHLSANALSTRADALRTTSKRQSRITPKQEVNSLAANFGLPKADATSNLAIVLDEVGKFEEACAKMSDAQTNDSRIGDGDSAEDTQIN
ncbi:MAG: hypothetical protein Q8L48_19890 [Archangium sp.]|nr:hypothetical protein [Archangium sp.]